MPLIHITLESGVSLAFIMLEKSDCLLKDVRKQMREEVDDLVPQEFNFISIWGPPLSKVQEAKMSIKDALHDGNKLVIRIFTKRKANEIDEGDNKNNCGLTTSSPERPPAKKAVKKTWEHFFSNESVAKKTEQNETVKRKSFPFPPIKMNLFTDDEISHHPCELERARRQHWNLKVNQINKSEQRMKYNNTELLGIIDTDWTLKKAELLQSRTVELQFMQERLENIYHGQHPPPPPKTISDNHEAVSKLLFYIKKEDTQLASITSKQLRDQTEKRLHDYLCDLKRTSDALFKAQNSREASLRKFRGKISEEWHDDTNTNILSNDEKNELASSVFFESQ